MMDGIPVDAEQANNGWTDMLDFRITVFSLKSCPHCKRAKAHLAEQGYDFYEISLTDYPEKRTDMVALSDRLTVPQIFLNDKHVGGAAELDHLIDTGELEQIVKELKQTPRTKDPRLDAPSYPPKQDIDARPLSETCITVGEQCLLHSEIVTILKEKLKLADRKWNGAVHTNAFIASEAVDLFMKEFKLRSRAEGVQVGDSLFHSQVFKHVTGEHPFEDSSHLFRLQIHEAINTWRVWNDRVDDPFVTLKECKARYATLEGKYMDNEGRVDYVSLARDESYQTFQEAVCEFQMTKVSDMSEAERKAFFINLYNLVVLHAFAQVGIPQTDLKRFSFFAKVGYQVEGHFLSLNDIENGILRGNKTAPYHLHRPFGKDDARGQWALPECERRVHFALNCGAASCPPIKTFTPEAIDEELRIAALAFMEMEENVSVDDKKKVLWVTKIISWYKSDFGDSDFDVAQTLMPWMRREAREKVQAIIDETGGIKVRYLPYDWSTNASMHKEYNPQDLKTKKGGCCSVM